MNKFPQLRVRTGYSFKKAYGNISEIIARLKEIDCDTAAMVDFETWGHARFEQAAIKENINPIFGMEIPIKHTIDEVDYFPRAWCLALDTKEFYQFTSEALIGVEKFPNKSAGIIRFPGAAIDALDPENYDYVDINPASLLLAKKGLLAAGLYDKKIILTSYNDFPSRQYTSVANAWGVGGSIANNTLCTIEGLWFQLHQIMSRELFDQAVENTYELAEEFKGIKLAKAPMIKAKGNIQDLVDEGIKTRLKKGHIKEWTTEYELRIAEEISQIMAKDFDSYFIVVSDLVRFAKQHMLVGPARGSSAGSLVCYVLGITEIDPIVHNLLFQRFIDISRDDLPDIDIDFPDDKRYMVFDYLKEKYGVDCVAKVGSVNTLKALSVIGKVSEKFNLTDAENRNIKNSLVDYAANDDRAAHTLRDTLLMTDEGKEYAELHEKAAQCMVALENHPSHSGVHAAGILVCNEPINNFCTVSSLGIAQIDKKDIEYLNLLKIDALGLRTLSIIEDTHAMTADELYSLPLDDKNVLDILNNDRVLGIFQFEGGAVRNATRSVYVDKFSKIDNLTALARPGPLSSGMANKYISRAKGTTQVEYDFPELEKHLKDTFGVLLYQEQIMNIVREVGGLDWKETSAVRKAIAKSKGDEAINKMKGHFIEGALKKNIPIEKLEKLWSEIVQFGGYCFNQAHSCSYAVVTYWTCYLKYYHQLEFSAACLRASKSEEQTIAILRELVREGVEYTAIDPDYSELNWVVADGRLIGGIMNAKGYGDVKALKYIEARNAGKLTDKQKEHLANAEVPYADLKAAHTLFDKFYKNGRLLGFDNIEYIHNMADIPKGQNGFFIAKLMKKKISDENDEQRLKRRGGIRKTGNTKFMDLDFIDDSLDVPMKFRIKAADYPFLQEKADATTKGKWYLISGWRFPNYDMIFIENLMELDSSYMDKDKVE
jgi:DNA-directed DNA polymerase III PolC